MKMIARALFVLGLFAMAGTAHAQYGTTVGQVLFCPYVQPTPGINNITISVGGVSYSGTSTGSGTFQVTGIGSSPSSSTYAPISVSATSNVAPFGTLTTSLTPPTLTPSSSTTAINIVAPFPANSRMTFNATATDPGGNRFISATPVTLQAIVNTFNPLVNETFTLAAPVQFNDAVTGNPAFTLTQLDAKF